MNVGLPLKSVYLLLLLCVLWPSQLLYGAATRSALFFIQNIQSDISLDYEYDRQSHKFDNTKDKTVNSQHSFEETYGARIGYSIYGHKYWTGRLRVRLGLEQINNSGTRVNNGWSSSTVYEYLFDGVLLKNSRAPLTLTANREKYFYSRDFQQDYNVRRDGYSATLNVKSRVLPSTLQYNYYDNKTDGLLEDNQQILRSFSLNTSHLYRNFSRTSFSYSINTDKIDYLNAGDRRSTDTMSYNITNTLKPRLWNNSVELQSSYRYVDETGDRDRRETYWREALDWDPGRALRGNFTFRKEDQRWFENNQDLTAYWGTMSHQLFNSLVTSVTGQARKLDFDNGTQKDAYISGKLSYSKRLSLSRKFFFSAEHGIGEVDRDLDTDTLTAINERMVVSIFEPNLLFHSNVIQSSVVVRRADTGQIVPGSEYLLEDRGEFTEIIFLPGGSVSDGDVVLINYDYRVDPSVKYSNNTTAFSSSLSMDGGRLSIYARAAFSNQNRRSGENRLAALDSSDLYNLGVKGERGLFSYSLDGKYLNRTDSYTATMTSYLGYSRVKRASRFSMSSRYIFVRYNKNESEISPFSDSTNTHRFISNLMYFRAFPKRISARTEAEYLLSYSGGEDTHETGVLLALDARAGKTVFSLIAEDDWRFYGVITEHTTRVYCSMRRQF